MAEPAPVTGPFFAMSGPVLGTNAEMAGSISMSSDIRGLHLKVLTSYDGVTTKVVYNSGDADPIVTFEDHRG
jgi:hypothetical protein